MSERITITHARNAFDRLARALNADTRPYLPTDGGPPYKANVGAIYLDNNPIYGGCQVEQIITETGAITHPFGAGRMKPAEFFHAVNFALDVLAATTNPRYPFAPRPTDDDD